VGVLKRLTLAQLRTAAVWLVLALSLGGGAYFSYEGLRQRSWEQHIADGSIVDQPRLERPELEYAAGWWLERRQRQRDALEHYVMAENAQDTALAARAKLALGNRYLEIGLSAVDVASGGSHIRGLAQLELAREAYRGALRLDPDLSEARHNLELLERLSPERRTQGWSREQRNVHLLEGHEQGWAGMKETDQRGLP